MNYLAVVLVISLLVIIHANVTAGWLLKRIYKSVCSPGCPEMDVDQWTRPFRQPGGRPRDVPDEPVDLILGGLVACDVRIAHVQHEALRAFRDIAPIERW